MTAVVIGGVLAVTATDAPANNRGPTPSFAAFPGPSEVTFGKNVSYTTSFQNESKSMYTKVNFTMQRPSTQVRGVTMLADLVYASCEPGGPPFSGLTSTSFSCPTIEQLPAGSAPVKLTLVWKTPSPSDPDSLVCGQSGTDCTLTATAAWGIKENQPGSNDTFPVGDTSQLLVQPDKSRAGGYPISKCTNPATETTLETNLKLGTDNPLATKVCAPSLPIGDVLNPGLVVFIDEKNPGNDDPPGLITQVSDICIPAVGETCPSSTKFTFAPTPATFTFVINNRTLPNGEKVDKVFHDGVQIYPTPSPSDPARVKSITIHNPTKTTTVVVESPSNGKWGFG